MLIQQVSYNNFKYDQSKKTASPAFSSSQSATDKVDLAGKKSKKSGFEKVTLGILSVSTLTGLSMIFSRKNIAKSFCPQLPPNVKIKDDTIEQAVSYLSNYRHIDKLNEKSKEELVELSKHANEESLAPIMRAYLNKLGNCSNDFLIKILEPVTEKYFKCEKPSYEQCRQISSLAHAYDKEKMSQKAYDLLIKADKKWPNESYDNFNKKLVELYSQNGLPKEAINVWEKANDMGKITVRYNSYEYLLEPLKCYKVLGDDDSIITQFKKCNCYYNEDLTNIYIDSMLKNGKQKELMVDLTQKAGSYAMDADFLITLLKTNISKINVTPDEKKVIDNLAQIVDIHKESLSLSSSDRLFIDNIPRYNSCINALKGKFIPEESANNILEITDKLSKTNDSNEYHDLISKLYSTKYFDIGRQNPSYSWLVGELVK